MTLQIDNVHIEQLARRLAEATGLSQDDAVEMALREKLSRVEADAPKTGRPRLSVEEMKARAARIRAHMTPEQLAWDYEADLYDDETGLPK